MNGPVPLANQNVINNNNMNNQNNLQNDALNYANTIGIVALQTNTLNLASIQQHATWYAQNLGYNNQQVAQFVMHAIFRMQNMGNMNFLVPPNNQDPIVNNYLNAILIPAMQANLISFSNIASNARWYGINYPVGNQYVDYFVMLVLVRKWQNQMNNQNNIPPVNQQNNFNNNIPPNGGNGPVNNGNYGLINGGNGPANGPAVNQ